MFFLYLYSDKTELYITTDVYDMVKYDCIHNSHLKIVGIEELYYVTREFADCVVPQEFGIFRKDKRILGSTVCSALLEKLKNDLTRNDMNFLLDQRFVKSTSLVYVSYVLFVVMQRIWLSIPSVALFGHDCISLPNHICIRC